MLIQVNHNHSVQISQEQADSVKAVIESALSRFSSHITSLDVHLSDTNSSKNASNDKRCQIEVRAAGLAPLSVSDETDDLMSSCRGAGQKMKRALDHALAKAGHI